MDARAEDRLARAGHQRSPGDPFAEHPPDRLRTVERKLHELTVPYEEWEVLFRQTLLAQRELAERVVTALAATAPLLEDAEALADRVRALFRRAA